MKIKRIVSIVLNVIILGFLVPLFLSCGLSFIKSSLGTSVFCICFTLLLLWFPVKSMFSYIRQNKAEGKNWIAKPAIAILGASLMTCCFFFAGESGSAERAKAVAGASQIQTTESASGHTLIESESSLTSITTTSNDVETLTGLSEQMTDLSNRGSEDVEKYTQSILDSQNDITPEMITTAESSIEDTTAEETTVVETTSKQTETRETTVVETSEKETTRETTTKESTRKTGKETTVKPPVETQKPAEERDYVLNINTKKFHLPGCSSVSKMKKSNRKDVHCSRDKLINDGYSPCGNCHP